MKKKDSTHIIKSMFLVFLSVIVLEMKVGNHKTETEPKRGLRKPQCNTMKTSVKKKINKEK